MGKKQDPDPGSGFNNLDHISESLETKFLGLKYFNYLMRVRDGKNSDPGMEKIQIRDPGWEKIRIRDKHPGSAKLPIRNSCHFFGTGREGWMAAILYSQDATYRSPPHPQ
jgi:hypothetical protein